MIEEPILSVRNLKKHYPMSSGILSGGSAVAKAVDGISFDIYPGETLGLVGESGCGKSTAATSIIQLEEATDGEVIFNGTDESIPSRDENGTHPNDVTEFDKNELKAFRREAQMIFQDPSSSFDPRMSIGNSIGEMLLVHGMKDKERRRTIIEDLLEKVGLSAEDYDRYPHEFSGGQKQRIAVARALVLNPDFIVADEPVSALDVSIQAEVLSLINDLQEEYGLSMLFISHDMSVIRKVCDRVAVMYLGEIVEIGRTEELFNNPQHPYTEALISSIPTPDPTQRMKSIELKGTVPNPVNPPSGCRFHTRCHKVIQPDSIDIKQEHWRVILNFRDRLARGQIDLESIRESALATENEDATNVADNQIEAEIRREFDLPKQVSDGEVQTTLDSALDSLLAGDVEAAAEQLAALPNTPCEETDPEYTDHGDGHKSACLLHDRQEKNQSPEYAVDD